MSCRRPSCSAPPAILPTRSRAAEIDAWVDHHGDRRRRRAVRSAARRGRDRAWARLPSTPADRCARRRGRRDAEGAPRPRRLRHRLPGRHPGRVTRRDGPGRRRRRMDPAAPHRDRTVGPGRSRRSVGDPRRRWPRDRSDAEHGVAASPASPRAKCSPLSAATIPTRASPRQPARPSSSTAAPPDSTSSVQPVASTYPRNERYHSFRG